LIELKDLRQQHLHLVLTVKIHLPQIQKFGKM